MLLSRYKYNDEKKPTLVFVFYRDNRESQTKKKLKPEN